MFKKNNKNNEEVIRMEQTTFIQRHAKKIMIAGGIVVGAGAAYLLYKYSVDIKTLKENHSLEIGDLVKQHDIDIYNHDLRLTNVENKLMVNTEIAVKALTDTKERYEFEIAELVFKRDNLDPKAAQNIFMNIPKLNEEIELKTKLKENVIDLLEKAIENGKTE